MRRRDRIIGRAVTLISAGAVAAVVALGRPAAAPVVALLVLAMAWGALPQAIDAFLGHPRPLPPTDTERAPGPNLPATTPSPPDTTGQPPGTFTFVVRIGGEPAEIAAASVAAAAAGAPTVAIADDAAAVARLGPLPVPVYVGRTIEGALNQAVAEIGTDAFLVLSARSFGDVGNAETAAAHVRAGAGWVVGHVRSFNRDGFAPLGRARLASRLRNSARAGGLELWEGDATLVSTRLAQEQPFRAGRSWGASLREWAARGAVGTEVDLTLALRGEPVDARSYWPISVLRRRRAVAELSDAVTSGSERTSGRQRWLAGGLLLRELAGCRLALWLLMPCLFAAVGGAPLRSAAWVAPALVAGPAILRWWAERRAHRVRCRPLEDALALAFDAPGSVLALPAVVSRRARPTRVPLPGQPLVVAALVFAAFTLLPLLSLGSTGSTAQRTTTVALAITELALLWMLAMRVIFQRSWTRAAGRVAVRLPARVNGRSATTLDVSPGGLALAGDLGDVAIGARVDLDVELDDGSTLSAEGTVVDLRQRREGLVAGISMPVGPGDRGRWITQLSRAAALASVRPMRPVHGSTALRTSPPTARSTLSRWGGRVLMAGIGAFSLIALGALCLVLVGYRPLIVRSGSMTPALRVGDVVFVKEVPAGALRVGDIATFPACGDAASCGVSDSLTHRVRSLRPDGTDLIVTTRGDANSGDETFTIGTHALAGRVVLRVPGVGSAVAWAGGARVRWAAGLGACALLGGYALARRRRGLPRRPRWRALAPRPAP